MTDRETYQIVNPDGDTPSLNYGPFSQQVFGKHISDFGEAGASKIRDAVHNVFIKSLKQIENPSKSNNVLLVGKVQSGKTSNLESLTALAFDNGFNLMIIYGGSDLNLLGQTTKRFKNTFNVTDNEDDIYDPSTPAIFSTGDDDLLVNDLNNTLLERFVEYHVPVIITAMKRTAALKSVNDFLHNADLSKVKCLIIDDEGDQAGLNTKKNKETEASATYACICTMKSLLRDPLYYSVTATPQANIFLNSLSALKPSSIHLLYPGKGYCGADVYHTDTNLIESVDDNMEEAIESNHMPDSLKKSINYFILASTVMKNRGVKSSDMIIHSFRERSSHKLIYNWTNQYIEQLKAIVSGDEPLVLDALYKQFNNVYIQELKNGNAMGQPFEELWPDVHTVVKNLLIVLQNSTGKDTQSAAKLYPHVIYIGGDLLQRGLTFKKLVTTYYTRWPKDGGNMDTNLQRARWFGYREQYIDLCRVFMPDTIAVEFSNLSDIEDDLWTQFEEVETGEKQIEEIIISADSTSQRPTRKSVVNYEIVRFKSNWIKQRLGVFDISQVSLNNDLVNRLLADKHFEDGYFGSVGNRQATCSYAKIDSCQIRSFFQQLNGVYDEHSFRQSDILRVLGDEPIPVIKMSYFINGRKRSFYGSRDSSHDSSSDMHNKIKALHQGADKADTDLMTFMGDRFVIADKECVNLQIFHIIPIHDNTVENEYAQYMFALYVPGCRSYFVPNQE